MNCLWTLLLLAASISNARMWNPPGGPVNVTVKPDGPASLVLTDFAGKVIDPAAPLEIAGEKTVDIKAVYPKISEGGTFVLYVVPKDKKISEFEGTPLVVEARSDRQTPGAAPEVIKIQPLEFAEIQTAHGPMKAIFYYDSAPITVDNFLNLAREGFYDGLLFHRVVPGFVLQGGDPKGDGSGGPGYEVNQEFNDRPHEAGVLSMARRQDPNSAGSQFFICLDYNQTKQLDNHYTAFGKVIDGMDIARQIEKTPLSDAENGKPAAPQIIDKIEVKPVTAAENPYADLLKTK